MLGFADRPLGGMHVSSDFVRHPPPVPAIHRARRRGHLARAGCAPRAGRAGQDRRAASGVGGAGLFRAAGADRRATCDRGDQRAPAASRALGGAKIEPMLGDAQSTPDGGNAEVEKMNAAGVAAVVGGYASGICLAASQTAARYDLPYIVDVGVVDSIVTRGLKNTVPLRPGLRASSPRPRSTTSSPSTIRPSKPAKTVMIVHEDSAFGAGLAKLLNTQLPERGFQVLETISHPTPTRDVNNVVLENQGRTRSRRSRANYYNRICAARPHHAAAAHAAEGHLLGARAAPPPSYKFVKEFPKPRSTSWTAITGSIRPKNLKALALKKKIEDKGEFRILRSLHELFAASCCSPTRWSAPERRPRQDHRARWKAPPSFGHVMPYGPTEVRQRPERGAAPVNTQVLEQGHPGDPAGRLRLGEGGGSRCRADRRRRGASVAAVLSSVILVPAVLNGLMTGAVYALVALGLTLIYGVLHIISFAHGALLTAAMFAVFFTLQAVRARSLRRGGSASRRCSS